MPWERAVFLHWTPFGFQFVRTIVSLSSLIDFAKMFRIFGNANELVEIIVKSSLFFGYSELFCLFGLVMLYISEFLVWLF